VAAVLDPAGSPVLDVGTGKGLLAVALAERGVDVVSVDPDAAEQEVALAVAADAGVGHRLTVITGDAAEMPYADGHFSAAASMDVLHHLSDARPILSEMARVVSPHGEILLADFSREGFELVASVHQEEGGVHHESGVTADDAVSILGGLGFSVARRLTRCLHDIVVLTRTTGATGQATLEHTREHAHPHCLVCGGRSASGLRLDFAVLPDRSVSAQFDGGADFQGYPDALHGGLTATLLDAAMTNCLFARGIKGVTARLNIRYLHPVRWYQSCRVNARLLRSARGLYYLTADVRQAGQVVATAEATFKERATTRPPGREPAEPHGGTT
jgi:SAM-dependent methyltransferase